MLQLSLKYSNSTFNARGSRIIIVVLKLRSVKIYVAAVEALMQKERQDETQFTTKIDGFLMEALMQKERQDETQFITKIDGFLNVPFWRFFFF